MEGRLIKNFNLQTGGLLEMGSYKREREREREREGGGGSLKMGGGVIKDGGLIRAFMVCLMLNASCNLFQDCKHSP